MVRVAILSASSDIFVQGVRSVLLSHGYDARVFAQQTCSLSAELETFKPSLVLIDVLDDADNHGVSRTLKDVRNPPVILLLRERRSPGPKIWIGLRIDGVVVLDKAAHLLACTQAVVRGEVWIDPQLCASNSDVEPAEALCSPHLSPREREVVHFIRRGLRNKEIARRLNISEGTIKMHVHHISAKLGVQGRARIGALADTEADIFASSLEVLPSLPGALSSSSARDG